MIYTLTTNPSIDYYLYHDLDLREGIHRCEHYEFIVAGKGVNVSKMLAGLQMQSNCIVVCGGFTGDYIINELKKEKSFHTTSILIAQDSRINVKTRFNRREVDINTSGPVLDNHAKDTLVQVFDQVGATDFVCINGSLQSDMKDTILKISKKVHEKQAKLILDVPNITAEEILSYRPFLIKPNLEELKNLLQMDVALDEIIENTKNLFADNGINVLLSLGEVGSCYISSEVILHVTSAKVEHVVNTVAAGDSMLAGFVYMLANGNTIEETLKFASAAGSASVMSSYLPTLDVIDTLYQQISIFV